MSAISDKLASVGYTPLIENDRANPQLLAKLAARLPYPIPEDYKTFLSEYPNSGRFNFIVACEGITRSNWAPDARYDLTMLYASSSRNSADLLSVREDQDPSEVPEHFLIIGRGMGGNEILMDLSKSENQGIYYWMTEGEVADSSYLLADNFESFIGRLVAEKE